MLLILSKSDVSNNISVEVKNNEVIKQTETPVSNDNIIENHNSSDNVDKTINNKSKNITTSASYDLHIINNYCKIESVKKIL